MTDYVKIKSILEGADIPFEESPDQRGTPCLIEIPARFAGESTAAYRQIRFNTAEAAMEIFHGRSRSFVSERPKAASDEELREWVLHAVRGPTQ